MHVVLCFFFLLLFFLLFVYCEVVSQRITELSWDYILIGRWTSWHLAGDCDSMDFVSSVFAFYVLGYLFRFWR